MVARQNFKQKEILKHHVCFVTYCQPKEKKGPIVRHLSQYSIHNS